MHRECHITFLMLLLVIFDKNTNGSSPFSAKIGTNDVSLQYNLCHFQTPEKSPKTANLINVIYKLIYL